MAVVTDRELVLDAQRGEAASLGVLLERHRARLTAEGLRLLHDRAAAEDAVQDTSLIALRRIGDLRDPGAARAWLTAILRNACHTHRRSAPPEAEALDEARAPAATLETPEQALEHAACRDWLWTALAGLPEPVRATVLLRHFGTWSSYDEIAEVLGVPVGTVRSRLHNARAALADALRACADEAHVDADGHRTRQEAEFAAAAAELSAGSGCDAMCGLYDERVVAGFADGTTAHGRRVVRASLEGDLAAGIRMQVTAVMSSGDLTIVEATLTSPPDDPWHCPPATCQVHLRPEGRTSAVQLWFAPRTSVDVPTPRPG